MARNDAYLEQLTIHLSLAEVPGDRIGAILEETHDHLDASGETAEEAFGPPQDYAASLVGAYHDGPSARVGLGRADLVAGGIQIVAWQLLGVAGLALGTGTDVAIVPGHLAGSLVLIAALAWPVWPAVRAALLRTIHLAVAVLAMTAAVAVSVAVQVSWSAPVLAEVTPIPAVAVALVVIAACWHRAFRRRDPIRRPS